jgi:hypothetical protein
MIQLRSFISTGVFAALLMLVQPASAHWYLHAHPTQWAPVPHGIAHKHYDHRKGYKMHKHRTASRHFKQKYRNFWRKMKHYKFPMIGAQRLDFCYKKKHFCGRVAANEFCKLKGFEYTSQFKIDRHALQTRSIGDRKLNRYPANKGNGFRYIRCRKH